MFNQRKYGQNSKYILKAPVFNLDLTVTQPFNASCETNTGLVSFDITPETYDIPEGSVFLLTWLLNGEPIDENIIENIVGSDLLSISEDGSVMTVNSLWEKEDTQTISFYFENTGCESFVITFKIKGQPPLKEQNKLDNIIEAIYTAEASQEEITLTGGSTENCKTDIRMKVFTVTNTGGVTIESGTVFNIVWTGLGVGHTFSTNDLPHTISGDGLIYSLVNPVPSGLSFQIRTDKADVDCDTPFGSLSITITTEDYTITGNELLIS
jgi:hypothetical protein